MGPSSRGSIRWPDITKIYALALVALLAWTALPTVTAGETETRTYVAPWTGTFRGASSYVVVASDLLPSDPYITACIITDHQDGRGTDPVCGERRFGPADDIPDPSVAGCGAVTIATAFPADWTRMTVKIHLIRVDLATGAVCLGSAGTVSVTYD